MFGRFWDGMSFLVASIGAMRDLLGEERPLSLGDVGQLLEDVQAGRTTWPREFLLWQALAHTIVQSHGLLDEYVRACFELLALSEAAASQVGVSPAWDADTSRRALDIEQAVRRESERFEQLTHWRRLSRLRKEFGLQVRHPRELENALIHHRRIRNGVVHGQLTPHVIMPDGTVGRMRGYAPPPYVPLGMHIMRGAMSVLLAAHRTVDAAMVAHLGLVEDPATVTLIEEQIERGREHWLVDPWEPNPEHLFTSDALRALRPTT